MNLIMSSLEIERCVTIADLFVAEQVLLAELFDEAVNVAGITEPDQSDREPALCMQDHFRDPETVDDSLTSTQIGVCHPTSFHLRRCPC